MTARVAVAVGAPHDGVLAEALHRAGLEAVAMLDPLALSAGGVVGPGDPRGAAAPALLQGADTVIVWAHRSVLTRELVTLCDRGGARIVAVGSGADADRLAAAFGLDEPVDPGDADAVVQAVRRFAPDPLFAPVTARARDVSDPRGSVIAVWGPEGAPGRSTLAAALAFELARGAGVTALVDADTRAPSQALALGLPDEGPGFAAACRHAESGDLDAGELLRISIPVQHRDAQVDVLCGINRPARWPELSASRVAAALEECRRWARFTVVDVAPSLEEDDEITSDLEGPRRNAATLAALRAADVVVAVCAAEPVGVARFLRAHADLRQVVGPVPVLIAVNRLRPGGLGFDGRGQVRRALARFAGVDRVWFLPEDPRATDAAVLQARPLAEVAPRSPLVTGVRRLVGEGVMASIGGEPAAGVRDEHASGRGSRRGARRTA